MKEKIAAIRRASELIKRDATKRKGTEAVAWTELSLMLSLVATAAADGVTDPGFFAALGQAVRS